jgi:hypothetical protein
MIRRGGGVPTYLACSPWHGVAFGGGGGSSTSSTSQTTNTTNEDARSAADTGSISATSGASLSNVNVYNTSSDPTVIMAALNSLENQLAISSAAIAGVSGAALQTTGGLAASAIAGSNDLATTAIHENAGLSQDAIDQWAQVIHQALDTSGQSITQALNAVAGSAASSSALASQSLGQVAPLQTTLKVIVYAFAAVAIVYFLSRDAK